MRLPSSHLALVRRRLAASTTTTTTIASQASLVRRSLRPLTTSSASFRPASAYTGTRDGGLFSQPPLGASSGTSSTAGASLTITDPLDLYMSKAARGELRSDPDQIRVMVALRNLSRRLEDYTPPAHLLGILSRDRLDSVYHGARRPPAMREGSEESKEWDRKANEDIQALTTYLSQAQELGQLDTPKGIILTGPPGRGKTELLDIWYESLPTQSKFRRHYHHLLLTIYRLTWLEAERRRKALGLRAPPTTASDMPDLSSSGPRTTLPSRGTGVVWKRGGTEGLKEGGKGWRRVLEGMPFFRPDSLAPEGEEAGGTPASTMSDKQLKKEEMQLAKIQRGDLSTADRSLALHVAAKLFLDHGHILMFDEIQLVDVSSASLLRQILTAYWRLGGVIVGSSNRLPEDLYANNVQRRALTEFLGALRERCDVVQMEEGKDWRRESEWMTEAFRKSLGEAKEQADEEGLIRPGNFFVKGDAKEDEAFEGRVKELVAGRKAEKGFVTVYGRKVAVPYSILTSPDAAPAPSLCRYTFAELCDSPLGPADYLTLASTYRVMIIDDVPQLPLASKNQARRLITLLDALYEAGCTLVVRAMAPPDELFFPEERRAAEEEENEDDDDYQRALDDGRKHTLDQEADDVVEMSARGSPSPFKTPPPGAGYPDESILEARRAAQSQRRERKGRGARQQEMMSDTLIQSETLSEAMQDVEEGFRPNISSYKAYETRDEEESSVRRRAEPGRMSEEQEKARREELEAQRKQGGKGQVGFMSLSIFSGEDERFAYQRAVSRLHEMSHPGWGSRRSWRPFVDREMALWGGGEEVRDDVRVENVRHREAAVSDPQDFGEEASYQSSTFPGRFLGEKYEAHFDSGPVVRRASTERPTVQPETAFLSQMPPGSGSATPTAATRSEGEQERQEGRTATRRRDDGPPVLSPAHVWGVREDWGPKAGEWGKGARARARAAAAAERESETKEGEEDVRDENGETPRERRKRLAEERKLGAGAGGR